MSRARAGADWPAQLSSPSWSQEGGNEPSCRALSAELHSVRPIPPREAGGLLDDPIEAAHVLSLSTSGKAAAPCRSRPQGGAAGVGALPCQNSNNSNQKQKRYRLTPVPGSSKFYTTKDNDRAVWEKLDGDIIQRWGCIGTGFLDTR